MSWRAPGLPPPSGWFTSSYSNGDYNSTCVQAYFDGELTHLADSKNHGAGPVIVLTGTQWDVFLAETLGAAPSADAGVRISLLADGGRAVTAADGAELRFTTAEWAAFHAGVADGEFDRPVVVELS